MITLLQVPDSAPCAICKTDTRLVDVDFECHICSEKCWDAIWTEYEEANARLGPPEGWDD